MHSIERTSRMHLGGSKSFSCSAFPISCCICDANASSKTWNFREKKGVDKMKESVVAVHEESSIVHSLQLERPCTRTCSLSCLRETSTRPEFKNLIRSSIVLSLIWKTEKRKKSDLPHSIPETTTDHHEYLSFEYGVQLIDCASEQLLQRLHSLPQIGLYHVFLRFLNYFLQLRHIMQLRLFINKKNINNQGNGLWLLKIS